MEHGRHKLPTYVCKYWMEILLLEQETLLLSDIQTFDFPSVQQKRAHENRYILA